MHKPPSTTIKQKTNAPAQRNIPTRGPKPVYYTLAALAVMAYGWRQLFLGNREQLELGREKMWSRIHLIPLLQAEEDRDQVRRYYADLGREKQLLGSETRVMNSDKYVFLSFLFCGRLFGFPLLGLRCALFKRRWSAESEADDMRSRTA